MFVCISLPRESLYKIFLCSFKRRLILCRRGCCRRCRWVGWVRRHPKSLSRSQCGRVQVAGNHIRIDARSPRTLLSIHPLTMSSAQPPGQPPNNPQIGEKPDEQQPLPGQTQPETKPAEDAVMDTAPDQPPEESWDDIPEEIMALPTEDIQTRTRLIDNDIKVEFLYSTALLAV